jgi:parallel beta helix pectate lyase-like protein
VTVLLVTTRLELEAALVTGGEVYVANDVVIELDTPLYVTAPTRVIGGSFYVFNGPGFVVTSSDVEFRRVSIRGGGIDLPYDPTQKLIHVLGSAAEPLSNVQVIDCRLTDSRGDNIWLEWTRLSTVRDCVIERFLYSGVMVLSGDRVKVNDNVVEDAPLTTGVPNVYGIAVSDLTNTLAGRSTNVQISGNVVSLIDWEGIDTHGGDVISIVGNTVLGCQHGIALVTGNATRIVAPTRCLVVGNTVDGAGARRPLGHGIGLDGIANTPASGTIVGNQILTYTVPYQLNYWARDLTYVANNSKPHVGWRSITLGSDYTANASYPAQYTVDGNTVTLRAGVIPKSGGVANRTDIGSLDKSAAWPTRLTFVRFAKGSNASGGNAQVAVTPGGDVQMLYGVGTDTYTYFIDGTYQVP